MSPRGTLQAAVVVLFLMLVAVKLLAFLSGLPSS